MQTANRLNGELLFVKSFTFGTLQWVKESLKMGFEIIRDYTAEVSKNGAIDIESVAPTHWLHMHFDKQDEDYIYRGGPMLLFYFGCCLKDCCYSTKGAVQEIIPFL